MERVRADLDQGRLWKARDRLHGLLQADPSNQEILGELGEVYFRMGDLPQAGRYWYLTERSGQDAALAAQAFEERFGRSSQTAVQVLPVRGSIADYPEAVQARLAKLASDIPKRMRGGTHTGWVTGPSPDSPSKLLENLKVILILLITVGVWLAGVIALFVYFF